MATLLFHLPNKPNIGSKQHQLLPEPLKKILSGVGWGCLMNSVGPSAQQGTLLTPQTLGKQARVQYAPDEQTWVDVLDKEKNIIYSVGYWNEEPPTPIDLLRKNSLHGIDLEINCQNWTIPILHPAYATVPRTFMRTADGITEKFKKDYQEICQRAEEFLYKAKDKWFWSDIVPFASDVLAINYRVTDWEAIDVLELMDTETVGSIMGIAMGYRSLELEMEAQKKSSTPANG